MGAGASSQVQNYADLGKSPAAIVEIMMPLYYDAKDLLPEERKTADESWQLIVKDRAPVYLAKLGTPDFHYKSCLTYFYDMFYMRLFDCHPMSKELFKAGIKGQSNALIKMLNFMLSLALSDTSKPEQFCKTMVSLGKKHHERGVKAVEYGILGDVLFWTLQKVLGDDVYSEAVHKAWIHIYSRMLKVVVPVAVSAELHDQEDHKSRCRRQEACVFQTMKVHTGEATTAVVNNKDDDKEEVRDSELVGSQKMLRGL